MLKVAVCIPCGHPKAGFVHSMANMLDHTHKAAGGAGIEIRTFTATGALIADLRMRLLADAMRWEPTHVLWLDDDMGFPRDALVRLLNHDVPVVGVNYVRRKIPPTFVARKLDDSGWLETREDSTGLEECLFTGMGLVLVKAWVVDELDAKGKMPCFDVYYDRSNPEWGARGRLTGEDCHFFRQCRAIGVPCMVDHDLSKEIMHFGDYPFTWRLVHVNHDL